MANQEHGEPQAGSSEKPVATLSPPPPSTPPHHRRPWRWIVGIVIAIVVLIVGVPWILKTLSTVSTDDAYVNGHVTFVAPRVPGQVVRVFVDDNNRVHKGDLLVQLDPEPYEVQVNIAQTAVTTAQADLIAAQAQARGLAGEARSARFNLEHAIEDVDNQIALLKSKVAVLEAKKAAKTKADADYERAAALVDKGAVSKEEMDLRREAQQVADADVEEAMEDIYQVRVSLGQPDKPVSGDDLTQLPPDLDETFSTVRQAQANLIYAAAQLAIFDSLDKSPREMIADFYKRDPSGDIDVIYKKILENAPNVKQAEGKLAEAESNLAQAQLNLSYTNVYAEIDGVITRRDVNPGNNVVAGQSVMAIRSLTDIWIDANFKETQLGSLRIGQPVDLVVDMYGSRKTFKGRISGFTMGTGSTLALLPAENATGNFVKVVQRLPVRIDLVDYDPDKDNQPLFVGLSVEPTVYINEEPQGADAGKVLQPYVAPATPQSVEPTTEPTTAPQASPETQP